MYRKILVPLDGSKLAECALDHVKDIATGCNVPEVDLLFVSEPPPPVEIVPYSRVFAEMEAYRARMKQYLGKLAADMKRGGSFETRVIMIEGNAAESIINYAMDNNVDLIIMSTHGRSGPSRWAFGSVTDRVTRFSTIPVLIAVPKGCRLNVSSRYPQSSAATSVKRRRGRPRKTTAIS